MALALRVASAGLQRCKSGDARACRRLLLRTSAQNNRGLVLETHRPATKFCTYQSALCTSSKHGTAGLEAVGRASLSISSADEIADNSSRAFRTHYCGHIGQEGDCGRSAAGEKVRVSGWVHSYRNIGKHGISFAVIRDWTGTVQVTWQSADGVALGLASSTAGGSIESDGEGSFLALETVVTITGVVRERPDEMVNQSMRTGAIEIVAESIQVLNHAVDAPVEVKASVAAANRGDEGQVQSEDFLLRHRHLHLRMPHLQRNIRVRSDVTTTVRKHLIDRDFVEVETPLLFKSTPEGAREFIVPTRTDGHFYALPQSPQQFKQLLMVGGIDRYFQIARCFRDESGRADRQPEFTQVDLEMSFVDREGIMGVAESLILDVFRTVSERLPQWRRDTDISAFALPDLSSPVPRMTFRDAMSRYGVDKPDTRFGMEIVDVTEALLPGASVQSSLDAADMLHTPSVQALRIPGLSGLLSRKQFDELAKDWEGITAGVFGNGSGAEDQRNLATAARAPKGADFLRNLNLVRVKKGDNLTVNDGGGFAWQSALAKHVGDDARDRVSAELKISDGDLVVVAAGCGWEPHTALGRLRLVARDLLASGKFGPAVHDFDAAERGDPQPMEAPAARSDLLWVVDFPMFEADEEGADGIRRYASSHHPFTAPAPAHAQKLWEAAELVGTSADTGQVLDVTAQHYDLVLNGCEIAGGSVRIHDASVQKMVFDKVLQIPDDRQETFRHLLAALDQGAPPHAGIAFGLDRIMSMLLGTESIRDVIAFPKSAAGRDLMTGAPAPVTEDQLKYYHQKLKPAADN